MKKVKGSEGVGAMLTGIGESALCGMSCLNKKEKRAVTTPNLVNISLSIVEKVKKGWGVVDDDHNKILRRYSSSSVKELQYVENDDSSSSKKGVQNLHYESN